MNIRERILELAKKTKSKIILPESFDIRILKAAQILTKDGIASVILLAEDIKEVEKIASAVGVDLNAVEIIKIDINLLNKKKVEEFVDARMKKGMTLQDASDLLKKPLYFSMMYLKSGKCDACVAGAVYDTSDVLRASIQVAGFTECTKLVSSYFLMIPPDGHNIAKEPVLFADCGVNPDPQVLGLKDIAVATVENFKKLFPGRQVNVAMLSFSTKGSANSKVLSKVIEATELVKSHFAGYSDINVDGEFQFDAAVVQSVGKKKASGSSVAGNANILIFPDLNAGNIGYKIAERYGGFQALGPIIQGLALPISDLSRGSSVDDICLICAIMLLK
ncbi:phosphate acetyltransferase [Endomicrobiia bacterium]|uniref:Phosphate acetyltransferase n=1 Tax=Endomicrobium trichonymphae TaxID=1408204 RepID=B1GZZ4_ENDTX|nr:phosphotransacetylase [Candidatus Endomicrobium trichonymphae]GHT05755.1 phosphate acetyltransferase [Endomicrobiia bacterium]BAG13826.1 phosphate acetyltransferase [Candidatus Endomicrobium trichonymphae]BAV58896.1 phosphate acetyltransferase [Candidatus Endomicrobium trichonymphae]GHT11603.1 phosphate acetyltransferase [Endomicrobiia bacterium]GHT15782.1 phosphate acetyltransferase [Endomicrobiia bacterium]